MRLPNECGMCVSCRRILASVHTCCHFIPISVIVCACISSCVICFAQYPNRLRRGFAWMVFGALMLSAHRTNRSEYAITLASWGVEMVVTATHGFFRKSTRPTPKTSCDRDRENTHTEKKFIISCTELRSFRIKKWHHEFGFINGDKRFYIAVHTNQFELSCLLVASFLFITFDVITLPATASNRRTTSTTLITYIFATTNFPSRIRSGNILSNIFQQIFFLIIIGLWLFLTNIQSIRVQSLIFSICD